MISASGRRVQARVAATIPSSLLSLCRYTEHPPSRPMHPPDTPVLGHQKTLIRYRPFRNCDPPGIANVWRSQPPVWGMAQPVTPLILEQNVFSKPYFDPAGLIVAVDGEQLVGFVHAGFGADDERASLCHETGVVCQLMVSPHQQHDRMAGELLAQAEEYLRRKGAKLIYGGGIFPVDPFYLGLYGGSELPGVLSGHASFLSVLQGGGYREIDRVVILQRELTGFRPPVDRRMVQARRQYNMEATFDPSTDNWWQACSYGQTDRTKFVLRSPGERKAVCTVTFWDMEPLASRWGVHAVGLIELETESEHRRKGLATFLVAEALRQLHAHGVSRCQVQAMQHNTAALGLYKKLGFEEVEQGIVLRKDG